MAIIDVHAEIGAAPLWGIPFSDAALQRSMQKYGVERSIIMSTIGGACDFRRGNAQVDYFVKNNKNFYGCVVGNINYPEQSQEDMHAYLSKPNFAGLVLTSGVSKKHVTLAESEELLNAHRRFIKPVFLYAFDKPSLIAANEIARAFNIMKFILLGMGGDEWRLATVLAERTLNLILEISGSFSPDKIKFAVDRIGSHRIVYGSSLPFVDPTAMIELVNDADISNADKKNIFETTAKRLFGWK